MNILPCCFGDHRCFTGSWRSLYHRQRSGVLIIFGQQAVVHHSDLIEATAHQERSLVLMVRLLPGYRINMTTKKMAHIRIVPEATAALCAVVLSAKCHQRLINARKPLE